MSDLLLWHGTSSRHLAAILRDGLRAPNFWGTRDMAWFFARQECRESGGRPVLFAMDFNRFDAAKFSVDTQMIDFPLTDVIGAADHGILEDAWDNSGQTWQDGLDIFHAVVHEVPVALTRDDLR